MNNLFADSNKNTIGSTTYFDQFEKRPSSSPPIVTVITDKDVANTSFTATAIEQLYIEVDIHHPDSLSAISLRFNTPIAEIKRINGILSDSEFFALRKIRIPIQSGSLLTELWPTVLQNQTQKSEWTIKDHNSVHSLVALSETESMPEEETKMASLPEVTFNKTVSSQFKRTQKLLSTVDKDVAAIRAKTRKPSSLSLDYPDDVGDGWDSESDEYISNDSDSLLLSSRRTGTDSAVSSGNGFYWCFLGFLVLAVILILILAKFEFVPLPSDYNL